MKGNCTKIWYITPKKNEKMEIKLLFIIQIYVLKKKDGKKL